MPRLLLECSPTYALYDRQTGQRYRVTKELHDLLDSIMHTSGTDDIEKEIHQLCLSV